MPDRPRVSATSSTRSLLITVLGDVVRPSGGQAWLGALTEAMAAFDVSDTTVRQALRRLSDEGLVTASRHGRLARYRLTDVGQQRFQDAAERIYLQRDLGWDGQWRMLMYTFPERERGAREALRRELEWLGFGSLGSGTWVCPWDLGTRLDVVLDAHKVAGDVEVFTAEHEGEDAALAARAYDLSDLRTAHAAFLSAAPPEVDEGDDQAAFRARVELVHQWRKFLFLDPGLPDALLPEDWLGDRAANVFLSRYRALEAPAWAHWDRLVADADPDGTVPPHRSNLDATHQPVPTAARADSGTRPDTRTPDDNTSSVPNAATGDRDAHTRRGNGATAIPEEEDPKRVEEFLEQVHNGRLVEPHDWMPETYRRLNLKFIEMHANSEIMGALPEREWIARAPTLKRKRSLAAKVQDEVGHGQLIYRVAESLGKPRRQMYDDLVHGRSSFHNVFHYPTHTWGDVACIGFLVDGAAIVTQRALLDTSYGPYVRVMKRVVAEESLHYRHGEDIMLALASGTDEQFAMLQEAVTRWWEPIMHFFGTDVAAEDDPSMHWGIKPQTNETSRQSWMSQYIPKMWDMGLELPDDQLRWDPDEEVWIYTEPDWDRLKAIVKGEGTEATRTRLWWRQLMHDNHDWIRDVLMGADDGVVTVA
ncbi:1,2-phenylacetyl-CoA epoxidase subunit PaaA [Salsipaludibacter albus]|uniref:1,2-phenylacetyl-CoA epoxidase subunit PaaA n=1 Tax=Salsipaludibacter albus TaxID=2849650 RepID=UPI001EE4BCD0|nr:1,2-phenylacetyl-CoA epoxidase subunit A [Salsipaludibacter albus]